MPEFTPNFNNHEKTSHSDIELFSQENTAHAPVPTFPEPDRRDLPAYLAYLVSSKLTNQQKQSIYDSAASAFLNNRPRDAVIHIFMWKAITLLKEAGYLEDVRI